MHRLLTCGAVCVWPDGGLLFVLGGLGSTTVMFMIVVLVGVNCGLALMFIVVLGRAVWKRTRRQKLGQMLSHPSHFLRHNNRHGPSAAELRHELNMAKSGASGGDWNAVRRATALHGSSRPSRRPSVLVQPSVSEATAESGESRRSIAARVRTMTRSLSRSISGRLSLFENPMRAGGSTTARSQGDSPAASVGDGSSRAAEGVASGGSEVRSGIGLSSTEAIIAAAAASAPMRSNPLATKRAKFGGVQRNPMSKRRASRRGFRKV